MNERQSDKPDEVKIETGAGTRYGDSPRVKFPPAPPSTAVPELQPLSGETPRTDAIRAALDKEFPESEHEWGNNRLLYYMGAAEQYAQEARQLERELAEANERAEKWAKQRDEFADRLEGAAPVSAIGLSVEDVKRICNTQRQNELCCSGYDCECDKPEDAGRAGSEAEARRIEDELLSALSATQERN